MKRLLYQHIAYNSVYVSYEEGWFYANKTLSPVVPFLCSSLLRCSFVVFFCFLCLFSNRSFQGKMQVCARQFVQRMQSQYGGLGKHIVSTALLLDFFAGFVPPRHLYTGSVFRVWGTLPFSAADYFTDGMCVCADLYAFVSALAVCFVCVVPCI